jgi:Protein of unknown function (DUF3617)
MRASLWLSVLPSVLAGAASAQTLPAGGLWELSMTLEGAPSGSGTRSAQACLAADALARAPEQTLFEAAPRQSGSGRAPPKCEWRDLRREAGQSAWQSVCEGPMGTMQGSGSGTLSADAAQLQQSFTVKAPFGSLQLKQTLAARRVGSC